MIKENQKRAIVLIDGQNLFHSLKNIGIDEKNVAWDLFFNSLLSNNNRLLAIYWFRPKGVKANIYLNKKRIAQKYIREKYPSRERELMQLFSKRRLPNDIFQNINSIYQEKLKWLNNEKLRFSNVNYKYKKIEDKYSEVEIIRKGQLRVDPYIKKIIGEKGVDVAVAVNMVELALLDKADDFFLISGDFDLFTAVKTVKKHHKKVILVELNNSGSGELGRAATRVASISEEDFKKNFLIRKDKNTPKSRHGSKKEDFINLIKKLVIKDELNQALTKLHEHVSNNKIPKEVEILLITLQGRLKQNNNSINLNIITTSEANLEIAKIRVAILNLLDDF